MATINVIFTDSTESTIQAYIVSSQNPAIYPNQGQVDSSDARWSKFYIAQPENIQQSLLAPTV